MKKLIKKGLSLFLAIVLAATILVSALAFTSNSEDIIGLGARFTSGDIFAVFTNSFLLDHLEFTLKNVYKDADRSCIRVVLYDSNQAILFDSDVNAGSLSFYANPEYYFFDVATRDISRLKRNEEYTAVISEGSFTGENGLRSPEFRVTFEPDEFLPPTFWDQVRWFFEWIASWFG